MKQCHVSKVTKEACVRWSLVDMVCGVLHVDQLQQLSSQPNGQTRIDAERKLQKQKQDLDQQLSQKAQQLLQMRLVRCITVTVWLLTVSVK